MSELVRLIYASRAEFAPADPVQGVEPNVGRILMQSRRNNKRSGIGGVLYFGDGHFFQVLEGEREAVNRTYQRISGDSRHRQLTILSVNTAETRLFADWSMKYVPAEQSVREFLAARDYLRFAPLQFSESEAKELARLFHREHTGRERAGRFSWRRLFDF
ncbi:MULTISPECIES: BLUF domain-containing protein [Microbulbifer]|uniref:BLUF domain-containing protein n=1 Tax=Microbulbifer TaxID=48073 RepID=UPI001E3132AB|nr:MULTISPECIES: BLUF domain-containing protein [Microbulbifer]UHQ55213.1 BLUF domain-containing protein [Microbulbifer sp. YPW16]